MSIVFTFFSRIVLVVPSSIRQKTDMRVRADQLSRKFIGFTQTSSHCEVAHMEFQSRPPIVRVSCFFRE